MVNKACRKWSMNEYKMQSHGNDLSRSIPGYQQGPNFRHSNVNKQKLLSSFKMQMFSYQQKPYLHIQNEALIKSWQTVFQTSFREMINGNKWMAPPHHKYLRCFCKSLDDTVTSQNNDNQTTFFLTLLATFISPSSETSQQLVLVSQTLFPISQTV